MMKGFFLTPRPLLDFSLTGCSSPCCIRPRSPQACRSRNQPKRAQPRDQEAATVSFPNRWRSSSLFQSPRCSPTLSRSNGPAWLLFPPPVGQIDVITIWLLHSLNSCRYLQLITQLLLSRPLCLICQGTPPKAFGQRTRNLSCPSRKITRRRPGRFRLQP